MKKRMLDNRGASLYITLLVVIVLVFLSMSLLITIHTSSQKLNANTKEQLLKLELENVAYEYLNQLSLEDLASLEVDISCEFEYTTHYQIVATRLQTTHEFHFIIQKINTKLKFQIQVQFQISENRITSYHLMKKGYVYD